MGLNKNNTAKIKSMTRILTIVLTLFFTSIGFSQSEKNKIAFEKFTVNYNASNFEAIYNEFSAEMQKALPISSANPFFGGLQSQAGKIVASKLHKAESENSAIYKSTFDRGIFLILISVNNEGKINGLRVMPFAETSTSKIVSQLSNYPKEIADEIYENAKDFPNNTQLSIAVIKNGKVNYYGVQIINDELVPIENQDKLFEIGSLTKVFTSTILADLVLEGKLKLSDKINSYYPFIFKNKTQLTFESLTNHTSGLPRLPMNLEDLDSENPYKSYGSKELDFYLMNQLELTSASNNVYDYSNLGAGLLGYTLGLSQKTTLENLFENRIFKKYTMKNSFTTSKNIGKQLVKGLNENGAEIPNWDFDVLVGAGGILSTTADLVQFAQAQFDTKNKALELTRKQTATVNENMQIGLGWHLLKSQKGNDLIWHNGGTGGYSSSMVLDVQNKNGVIILSNVSGFSSKNDNIDEIGFGIISKIED